MRELFYYIGKPIRSLQTMLRVLSKVRDSQPSVVPDGIYGNDTILAVSAFQRQAGLPVTGRADSPTWERIVNSYVNLAPLVLPAPPLEIIWQPRSRILPGEQSSHLYIIQAMFTAISDVYSNAPSVEVTGIHTPPSVEAVKWLQDKSGRPATGVIDQLDWLHLTKLYRMTAGDGKSIYTKSCCAGDRTAAPSDSENE